MRKRIVRLGVSLLVAFMMTYLFTTPEPGLPDTTPMATTIMIFVVIVVGMLRLTKKMNDGKWFD
jgi:hypothetical protein